MSLRERAHKLAMQEVKDLPYLHWDLVVGLLGAVVNHKGMSICQDVIDGMKDALIDHFFDGLDPEWDNYGIYQWFENMEPSWFNLKPNDNAKYAPQIQCNKRPSDFKEP